MQLPLFEVVPPNKKKGPPPKASNLAVSSVPAVLSHSAPTTATPSPVTLVQRVIEVLGAIDLDPYNTSPDIPARQRYGAEQRGLNQPWQGRVWLNPPTTRAIQSWVEKLAHEYEDGGVTAAIVLLPARTNAQWWQQKLGLYPYCAIQGKLDFTRPNGKRITTITACAAVYLGPQLARFAQVFSTIGTIYIPYIG